MDLGAGIKTLLILTMKNQLITGIRFISLPAMLGLITILPAGTFNYWELYVYIGTILVTMIYALKFFLKNDIQFLERRMRMKEKQKHQSSIQTLFSVFVLSGFIVCGLDKRFEWSDIPAYVVLIADVIVLFGYLIIITVFRQNSYASRTVEIDNNQPVISNGLYSIVRHPMYIGVLIMFTLTPIALGSYWGLIPMSVVPVALILRIINEEKFLIENLSGYIDYCQKTRYRLIPFLW